MVTIFGIKQRGAVITHDESSGSGGFVQSIIGATINVRSSDFVVVVAEELVFEAFCMIPVVY